MITTLGKYYRDKITGFCGTATQRNSYLYDNPQVLLNAHETNNCIPVPPQWFPEARLEECEPPKKDKIGI